MASTLEEGFIPTLIRFGYLNKAFNVDNKYTNCLPVLERCLQN